MIIRKRYTTGDEIKKNPITFEMIEQKLKHVRSGKKITIWIPNKKTTEDKSEYRIVQGKVVAVYDTHIHVMLKVKKNRYSECFLKKDMYKWKFTVK